MDVSFSQTENLYLAESPARLSEETAQSLYADEQPKKRVKLVNMEHSKLAETVGIENNIMLNPEDLAKVATRNMNDEREFRSRQTGNFGIGSRQRSIRRQPYETSETNDITNSALKETRTSVIRGMVTNRQRDNTPENTAMTETDSDGNDYNLHCYEKVEKDNGESFGMGRHYFQKNVMDRESYATQSDNAGHISDKFSRSPISGNRAFQMAATATSQPYFAQQMRDAPGYRVQHPPEYALSQLDARGKPYFERAGLMQGSAISSYGALNPKYNNIQDGIYVQSHTESGYPGFTMYEGRPSHSSENLAKNNQEKPSANGKMKQCNTYRLGFYLSALQPATKLSKGAREIPQGLGDKS